MVIRHNVDQIIKPKRKTFKIVLLSILAVILGIGIWVGVSAYSAVSRVTALSGGGNLFSLITNNNNTLQGQAEGRTNILIMGMGGKNHPGGSLSDTMIVMSIDWKTKKTAMISVPRDLWVSIPGYNTAKLNEAYYYGEKNSKTTGGGGKVTSDMMNKILGIPIHYFVAVDFNGFKNMIDTVGGIDVTVDQNLYDPYYPADNMIDYSPFKITAGDHHLDGATALKFARSRETTSDFDRSKRQQKVIAALKLKLMTAGVLANPVKVTELLNTLGSHVTTNMSVNDIKSFWDLIKDFDLSNITNKVLDTSAGSPLVSSTSSGGAYIILPKKGANNYTDLQAIAKNIFTDTTSATGTTGTTTKTNADPKIQVLNGSGKAGQATLEASILEKEGYTKVTTGNANLTPLTAIYNCSAVATQTVADKIAKTLSAKTQTKTSCGSGIDIQVIIGQNALTR